MRVGGHPYIATIGHPNRLFMIDCHTMKEAYHYDIKKNTSTYIPSYKLPKFIQLGSVPI